MSSLSSQRMQVFILINVGFLSHTPNGCQKPLNSITKTLWRSHSREFSPSCSCRDSFPVCLFFCGATWHYRSHIVHIKKFLRHTFHVRDINRMFVEQQTYINHDCSSCAKCSVNFLGSFFKLSFFSLLYSYTYLCADVCQSCTVCKDVRCSVRASLK